MRHVWIRDFEVYSLQDGSTDLVDWEDVAIRQLSEYLNDAGVGTGRMMSRVYDGVRQELKRRRSFREVLEEEKKNSEKSKYSTGYLRTHGL